MGNRLTGTTGVLVSLREVGAATLEGVYGAVASCQLPATSLVTRHSSLVTRHLGVCNTPLLVQAAPWGNA